MRLYADILLIVYGPYSFSFDTLYRRIIEDLKQFIKWLLGIFFLHQQNDDTNCFYSCDSVSCHCVMPVAPFSVSEYLHFRISNWFSQKTVAIWDKIFCVVIIHVKPRLSHFALYAGSKFHLPLCTIIIGIKKIHRADDGLGSLT